MSPTLVRIDDRLLHGQVLLGWASSFRPERIVLASDEVAADPERRALYASLAEGDYEICIHTLAEAAEDLGAAHARTLMVLGSTADARRLLEHGARLEGIHIGGLHHAEGKKRLLDNVFLSEQDASDLQQLLDQGVELEARDLPGSRGVRIDRAALERLWS
ncbi:MAG: PTS system mannose/fructose/N-acetylgalactosamine-transporter subunit IIB [Candidatus Krumholzibacteriia bacterium]